MRALYGPGGRGWAPFTANCREARARQRARGDEALQALEGRPLEKVSVQAAAPGEYIVELNADGIQLSVRLGRNGARIGSVGV